MWWFPRRIPKITQIHDADDLNDGFLPFAEEVDGGKLDEHNFCATLKTALDLAADTETGYALGTAHEDTVLQPIEATEASAVRVRQRSGWQVLEVLDVLVEGALLDVIGGGQYTQGTIAQDDAEGDEIPTGTALYIDHGGDGWYMEPPTSTAHIQAAIRVDGTVYTESNDGNQDFSAESEYMELGNSGRFGSVKVNVVIAVTPGRHCVELVARCVVQKEGGDETHDYRMFNRELFVTEMGR